MDNMELIIRFLFPTPQARGEKHYYKVGFLPASGARGENLLQCPDKTAPYRELYNTYIYPFLMSKASFES